MRTVFAALIATAVTTPACAQLTVQQPVIGTFGGNFSVMVPDRGSALLGGVSSAGDSRSSYGLPFLRGSSRGQFRNNRSMWAHSRIIDLQEMDRMVLQAAETGARPGFARHDSGARVSIAFTDLPSYRGPAIRENNRSSRSAITSIANAIGRHASQPQFVDSQSARAHRTTASTRQDAPAPAVPPVSRALDPNRNYRLGLEAERSGRTSLAKLHYRTAAQHGSAMARLRLERMSQQPVASK